MRTAAILACLLLSAAPGALAASTHPLPEFGTPRLLEDPPEVAGDLAVATTGPYAGTVVQGETDTHRYSTTGPLAACLQVYDPRTYTVTLTHDAATDTLGLTAKGVSASSEGGTATVRFTANYCTEFTIQVEGLDVDGLAAYTVRVTVSAGGT